jgi:ribosomal protein S27AE
MTKVWYYLKSCPNCSTSIVVAAEAGVSPESPAPPFKVECFRCGLEVELAGKDLREQK